MRKTSVLTILMCLLVMANFALADTIRGINIDFVTIGSPGNLADSSGYGSVGHEYQIGKYEVTNSQWNTFTQSAGAPTGNNIYDYNENAYWTGDQQPTNKISWYEAAQFCNYLTSGDKSRGAYQFSGNNTNPGDFLSINRAAAISFYGTIYVIPTENEWYKAAYHKPDGSGYSIYANGTNIIPSTRDTCYGQNWPGTGPWNVGTGVQEQNGTFDMMGNVWELSETLIFDSNRGCRGGAYNRPGNIGLASSTRDYLYPGYEFEYIGFRVAAIVPEPASAMIMMLGAVWMAARRKR